MFEIKGLERSCDRVQLIALVAKTSIVTIKLKSPDSNLETAGTVGLRPRRAYRVEPLAMYGTQRVRRDFLHTVGMEKYRSEIAQWQVLARSTDRRGLTYTS